jgi:drug/metabolite transporter (DMT)-like permease
MKYRGFAFAFLGVLIFSFTLPMVKLALPGFSPWTLTFGRAAIAGVLAIAFLKFSKVSFPEKKLLRPLFVTAGGIVVGWPILTTLALQETTSAHAAVITAGLPLVTAILAVNRLHEHVPKAFWLAALVGTLTLVGYAWIHGGQEGASLKADLYLLGAVVAAAIGYVEGAALSRVMPGWHVVSWCVVLTLPISLPYFAISFWLGSESHTVTPVSLLAFLFTAFGSMYFGFFAWYRGLAELGVAKGSQVQLIQSLLTLLWSAWLLNEKVSKTTLLAASVVVVCIAVTQKARTSKRISGRYLKQSAKLRN